MVSSPNFSKQKENSKNSVHTLKKKKGRKLLDRQVSISSLDSCWRAQFPVGHEEGGRRASVNTFVPWYAGKILAKLGRDSAYRKRARKMGSPLLSSDQKIGLSKMLLAILNSDRPPPRLFSPSRRQVLERNSNA